MNEDVGEIPIDTARPEPFGSPREVSSLFLEWEIVLNPCPWCGKTPFVGLGLEGETGGTWVWEICCGNNDCSFKPKGRHVSVRKSQRFDLKKMKGKLDLLCEYWNVCDKYKPYEKLKIPLVEWGKFMKKQIGDKS